MLKDLCHREMMETLRDGTNDCPGKMCPWVQQGHERDEGSQPFFSWT